MKKLKVVLNLFKLSTIFVCFLLSLQTKAMLHERVTQGELNMKRSARSANAEVTTTYRQPPVIKTLYGKVVGTKMNIDSKTLRPVIAYLGIPYARPPTGEFRWKSPMDPRPWKGVFLATKLKPVCPQTLNPPQLQFLLPLWYRPYSYYIRNQTYRMKEDCLYLNIYVPAYFYAKYPNFAKNDRPLLKVMVFFHGHTFAEGSGNFYDGSVLASFGDVIVITFNYRLGIFGFLSTGNRNSRGNYGLWDQVKVLKWISTNIKRFGGDPDSITVFGSGAGAACIGVLMLSEGMEGNRHGNITRGWFRRAILQSGTSLSSWSISRRSEEFAQKIATNPLINCRDSFKMIDCLRNKTWSELLDAVSQLKPPANQPMFGPVVDGMSGLLKDDPINLLQSGEFTDYEVVVGVTSNDGFGRMERNSFFTRDTANSSQKPETSYQEKDFERDLSAFIESSYAGKNSSKIKMINEIIKFIYTDWDNLSNSTVLKQSLVDVFTDKEFVLPAIAKVDFQAEFVHPAYFYSFSRGTFGDDLSKMASSHGGEVPYVFGAPLTDSSHPLFSYNFTDLDKNISAMILTYWTNFAKYGDMTSDETDSKLLSMVKWPQYEYYNRTYMQLSSRPKIRRNYRGEKMQLWSSFLTAVLKLSNVMIQDKKIANPKPKKTNKQSNISTNIDFPTVKATRLPSRDLRTTTDDSTKSNSNAMEIQLILTLSIGFMLVFINIIVFSLISYRKEKDKVLIEKLKAEIKRYRKRDRSCNLTESLRLTPSNPHLIDAVHHDASNRHTERHCGVGHYVDENSALELTPNLNGSNCVESNCISDVYSPSGNPTGLNCKPIFCYDSDETAYDAAIQQHPRHESMKNIASHLNKTCSGNESKNYPFPVANGMSRCELPRAKRKERNNLILDVSRQFLHLNSVSHPPLESESVSRDVINSKAPPMNQNFLLPSTSKDLERERQEYLRNSNTSNAIHHLQNTCNGFPNFDQSLQVGKNKDCRQSVDLADFLQLQPVQRKTSTNRNLPFNRDQQNLNNLTTSCRAVASDFITCSKQITKL